MKALEESNRNDILIWFTEEGTPFLFGKSAILLNAYFPELSLATVLCSDGERHELVTGFPIEPVIERFIDCPLTVDDRCLHIMDVPAPYFSVALIEAIF